MMQLDFDHIEDPAAFRDSLILDPHVVAAWLSPSGTGVKGIAAMQPAATEDDHKAVFSSAETYFAEKGMKLDSQCKNTNRLCFACHDPEIRIRHDAPLAFKAMAKSPEQPEPENAKQSKPNGRSKPFPEPPVDGIHSEWLPSAARWCEFNGMDEGAAVALIKAYEGMLRSGRKFQTNEVEDACRFVYSTPLPQADEWAIPENVFPVLAGGISLTDAAKIIFPVLGATRKVFMRGGRLAEVSYDNGVAFLNPMIEACLQNVMENCGYSIKRREKGTGKQDGMIIWRKTLFPVGNCTAIMESDQAKIHLPAIKSLAPCPIMAKGGEILAAGYHKHGGGVFVTKGKTPPAVPFEAARQALWDLLGDFQFTTPADKSRAIASLISPALKMGGWINDDSPLDIAEADQSQSGKTYRQKLIQRIYDDEASGITPKNGGVGSVDESISTVLIAGRPFILLDNFRGRLDSPILESAIRGAGSVQCRGY